MKLVCFLVGMDFVAAGLVEGMGFVAAGVGGNGLFSSQLVGMGCLAVSWWEWVV